MIAENITGHAYGGSAERSIPAFGFRYSVTDLYNDIPEQVREAAATTSRSTWRGIHERIVESERQCGLASRNGRGTTFGVTDTGTNLTSGFNTYGIDWVPGKSITYYVNSKSARSPARRPRFLPNPWKSS
jgi:hypothetical protein